LDWDCSPKNESSLQNLHPHFVPNLYEFLSGYQHSGLEQLESD